MICSNCKKGISKDDRFCPYCGQEITGENKGVDLQSLYKEESIQKDIKTGETLFSYAGFSIRLGAFVVDYALMFPIAILFGVFIGYFGLTWSAEADTIVGVIFIVAYHTFFLSILSSTPGKILFGLEVIDEGSREKITLGKALGRSLSYLLSSLLFGLGFWTIAFNKPKHQGWHDKIAKTLVVKKTKKSLVLPTILSIAVFCFSIWAIYFWEDIGYDFNYLGSEATIINLIQERISQQPLGSCCSYVSSSEFSYYLKDIPSELSFKKEKNAEQIFEDFGEAIITVGGETEYGEFYFGSGFLISPSGLIVTNYHVIEDMDRLAVALGENKVFDVDTIVAEDPDKDIAVLKIAGQNLPYIVMGDSDLVKVGQKIFTIGNPEGYNNTISEGIISQIREFELGINSFQITAPISQGSSGGVLLNATGEVIGITNMTDWYGQNINFAIPINYVKGLLELTQNNSEFFSEDEDISKLIFCKGEYWEPCLAGQKFHCPKIGDPFCCEDIICNDECWTCPAGQKYECSPEGLYCCSPELFCNNKCWEPCNYGYKFICPSFGDAYCE